MIRLSRVCGLACLFALAASGVFDASAAAQSEQPAAPAQKLPGQLSLEELGKMLEAMGLRPTQDQERFDFTFKTVLNDEEWNLTMSTVLSRDGRTLWVMAWLDPLPRSATQVPRTALLRLLADNDNLGKGKFFAYIASNRRFVLQRTIPNYRLTTAAMRYVLKDLGESVVATYPHWSVDNWAPKKPVAGENIGAGTRTTVKPVSSRKSP